jgi:alpha-L-fucosidase
MSYSVLEEMDDMARNGPALQVLRADAVRDWDLVDGVMGQIVEITLFNPYPAHTHTDISSWVRKPISIDLEGEGFRTVRSGRVHRLMPGDQVTVQVIIQPVEGVSTNSNQPFKGASIQYDSNTEWSTPIEITGPLVHDWMEYSEDTEQLEQHRSPDWFNGAKFGVR